MQARCLKSGTRKNLSLGLCMRGGRRGVLVKNKGIPGEVIVKFQCLMLMAVENTHFS